jgi:maleylpyruvate isomerase
MRLYSFYRSSASYRVRLALHHKEIPFEQVPVSIALGEQRLPEHLLRNPIGQVPVLEVSHEGRPTYLAQSLAIIEYLEERFPNAPLLPREPIARAHSRELAEVVNAGIQPMQNAPLLARVKEISGESEGWAKYYIRFGLEAIERRARVTAGAFLVGDVPTLADVCLVPQMYNARRFEVPLEGLDTLVAIDERCRALPRWVRAHPDAQPDAPTPPAA